MHRHSSNPPNEGLSSVATHVTLGGVAIERMLVTPAEDALHEARPEMTILDAADAMERSHHKRLWVRQDGRLVGCLTEADIIRKVLAAGKDPETVTVADVMRAGVERADGFFLEEARIDHAPFASVDQYDLEGSQSYLVQGKCEECGVFSVDLNEQDGLLVCPDCSGAAFPF